MRALLVDVSNYELSILTYNIIQYIYKVRFIQDIKDFINCVLRMISTFLHLKPYYHIFS